MPLTEKQNLKLIRAVKANPLLYDHNDSLYMDFNSREVVWQKIGDQLKCPALECKSRWINIRDINRRILRRKIKYPNEKKNSYKYASELAFMQPYYKDLTIQNASFESNEVNDDDCVADMTSADAYSSDNSSELIVKRETASPKRKKRKVRAKEEKPLAAASSVNEPISAGDLDPTDQVDAFLLSIGATLKTFSPYHLNLAKSQIFAVVQEHDLQQIVKQGHSPNSGGQFMSSDMLFKNPIE